MLRELLFTTDPYHGFDASRYNLDLQGWDDNKLALTALIQKLNPKLALEVGSWKGLSASHIAQNMSPITELVCVDTWLGSPEFFGSPKAEFDLKRDHGYPTVYFQFLANMLKLKIDDRVTPFPAHSTGAAIWFAKHSIQFDFIYIDASHEEELVYTDIAAFYNLLTPTGVMCGDDYSGYWPGVCKAVDRFAVEHGIPVEIHEPSLWCFA